MSTIKHIPQEDPLGCLAATFAMANGITYAQACEVLGGRPRAKHSYYCDVWDQQMGEHGWAVVRKCKTLQPGNREREVWPLAPWADLHECEVQTGMIHSVLMLADGTVIDPLTPEPKKLSDYKAVLSIAALYPIATVDALRTANAKLEQELKDAREECEKVIGQAGLLRLDLTAAESRLAALERDGERVQVLETLLKGAIRLMKLASSDVRYCDKHSMEGSECPRWEIDAFIEATNNALAPAARQADAATGKTEVQPRPAGSAQSEGRTP
jgi:hypothetical protein